MLSQSEIEPKREFHFTTQWAKSPKKTV